MRQEELKEKLELHLKWIESNGQRGERLVLQGVDLSKADLRGADLRGADLYGADLYGADLYGADLIGADLSGSNLSKANLNGADLRGADLYGADLYGADLYGADLSKANLNGSDLRGADLRGADLRGADLSKANLNGSDLRGADLRGADLIGADLIGADLRGASFDEEEKIRFGETLSEDMIGYKKCAEGIIVELIIPKGSTVFSINNSKCRTNHAIVKKVIGGKRAHSTYKHSFTYYEKDEFVIKDFNLQYNEECASGIHFFRTLEEAKNYR